jgi:acyl-CoA dehydrogenase
MTTMAPLPWPTSLGPESRALYERTRRVGAEHLSGIESETPGRVNRALVRALADHDLLPWLFPERLGGRQPAETSALDLCILRDALAAESGDAETALAMQGLGAYPILEAGTAEVASVWIPKVAAGEAVAAFALSEPDAGSDAAALAMSAERDGDAFLLTGEKTWISNAPEADIYTVFARTSGDRGSRGVTAFAVPGDAAGLSGEPIDLISPHPIGRLVFDGVVVPADHVLGEVDHGFRVALSTLSRFRPSVGAYAVGMAQAALEAAQRHVDEREAFGGPLRDLQVVAHKVASMAVATHTARVVVYDAALAFDLGDDRLPFRSSAAKWQATETAQRVVDDAIQLHGAAALERGHRLEHLYREVRAPRIYEGASDVQLEIIARELAADSS